LLPVLELVLLAQQQHWPDRWLQLPMRLWLAAQPACRQPQNLLLLLQQLLWGQEQQQVLGFLLQVLQQRHAPS
jgi:hypothetical protein